VAPSGLAYTTPNVYTVGVAITRLFPTVFGQVVSYAVSPALPAGLILNTLTGTISGTPTVATGIRTYTVTATNSGGSLTFGIVITVIPSIFTYNTPNVYTVGATISTLTPTITGAIVNSYSIGPDLPAGLTFNTITGAISGTATAVTGTSVYTVTAISSSGNRIFDVSITVNAVSPSGLSYPTPNVITVGSTITTLTPTVSGGTVTSYSISPGLPAGLVFNTTTGTISGTPTIVIGTVIYTVTATNSGGSKTFPLVITVNDVLKINLVSKTDIAISGQSTGSITLAASGGSGGYLFSKDGVNFQSSPNFSSLAAGSYTFIVKDSSGKATSFNVTIADLLTLTATIINKTDVMCFGSPTGGFAITASGGTSPYLFSLGVGNTNYTSLSIFANLPSGSYIVNVIDANNTKISVTAVIAQPAVPFVAVVSGSSTLCIGSSGVLNSTSGTSYQWFLNNSAINGATGTSLNITQAGNYSVRVRNALECEAISNTFTVTTTALPLAKITVNNTILIKGEGVVLTASGGLRYEWTPAEGLIGASLNIASPTVKPLLTTTYTVTAFNANGCSSTAQITIVVKEDIPPLPNVFSPNGDGVNDFWVIDDIKSLPDHILKIFDRSGRILFTVRNYDNNWDGRVNGNLLEEGTYYYTISFLDKKTITRKGFITIVR
ncbi:MAG: gliding motility-associated C-terminal domain-containing protein, partial [Pedobacter sp.]|nr:gliding motility-associated C-terminal domain-containing protein [Pedobacter sp.]